MKSNNISVQLSNIDYFFNNPPPLFLKQEEAICYIIYSLFKEESYGTKLTKDLETSCYKMSSTILDKALQFLIESKICGFYSSHAKTKGRQRKMFYLECLQVNNAELSEISIRLKDYWKIYYDM